MRSGIFCQLKDIIAMIYIASFLWMILALTFAKNENNYNEKKITPTKQMKGMTGNQRTPKSHKTGTYKAVYSSSTMGKLPFLSHTTLSQESLTKAMVSGTINTMTKPCLNTLQDSNIKYGIVLGAGSGGFLVGIILTSLIFICKRKRCQRDESMTENKNKQTNVNDTVRRTQAAGGYSDVRMETLNEDQVGVYNHLREIEVQKNKDDTYDHAKPQHGHETTGSEYDKAVPQITIEEKKPDDYFVLEKS
ncbi:uncharacterized protein LOC128160294 isoform X2 [Crassostrea angulata]|uniref:uncharacterized protein LOC128160294 isoform X2 n=1 Tax=Magallana angulata TaxID=2784310 RepID=UPI0022B0A9C3|nr:uncharacterized protein LOC128160294 isoform X2 [Crassostrea angulata]